MIFPTVALSRSYSEKYLKNAMEAVRVMSAKQIEAVVSLLSRKPNIYILTDNNTLESLSDTNFYMFADEVRAHGIDLTSSITMLMILELLIYEYIAVSGDIVKPLQNSLMNNTIL